MGRQGQVAANRELDAVRIQGAEKVAMLRRILPRFRNVHGYPARTRDVKLRPAVIAGDVAMLRVFRQRKSNLKPRGNVFRAHHGDEKRVEVGAVAVLRIAGPERIAAAPAGARFVVAQRFENVIVNSVCLFHGALHALSFFIRQFLHLSINRNHAVRLRKSFHCSGRALRPAVETH